MFILLSLLLACGSTPSEPVAVDVPAAETPASASASTSSPHATLDFDDPTVCAACHGQVVEEWRTSMHSQAHHDNDPIYGSMRTLRMKKQGAEIADKCVQCHNPRDTADPDSAAGKNGVSGATCHAATAVDGTKGPGAKALSFSTDTLRGPHDLEAGASPVHGTGEASPLLADGQSICLACHDATQTPAGEAACTTGPEYIDFSATAGDAPEAAQSCAECHMPRVEGASGVVSTRADHASHAFMGPHHAWTGDDSEFMGTAVDLDVTLAASEATVTLVNRTGHSFPTGFPGRMAVLMVVARDASGEAIWTNISEDPMADSPQSVLNKVYVDADGTPTPAAFAKELERDNRLKPKETRTLTYALPEGVAVVEAKVVFRLLPPKLAEKLGLSETAEAEPRVVKTASSSD